MLLPPARRVCTRLWVRFSVKPVVRDIGWAPGIARARVVCKNSSSFGKPVRRVTSCALWTGRRAISHPQARHGARE